MLLFARLTATFAVAFLVLLLAVFVLKVVVVAAIVAGLALAGIFLFNLVRTLARGRGHLAIRR